MAEQRVISKTVVLLSLVSMCTDMASEMLYPIMPLYLKEIGFSIVLIGVLEGIAEAVAGLSKGYFGAWSDRAGVRMPFVRSGYALSAVSKPMMALFTAPWWIFFARLVDRTGKGIRTGARDAMLANASDPAHRAKVFGFHRALDTTGAMIGPSIALLFLFIFPGEYRALFLLAFIPGVAAIAITFLIREKRPDKPVQKQFPSFRAFYQYWVQSPAAYRRLTGALLVFALVNSSDVLLLLRLKETGISDTAMIGVYIFYNAVYAALAYPAGILADKIGLKQMLLAGLLLFAVVYCGMCFKAGIIYYIGLFLLYGCYAAATEGISKAWITQLVPRNEAGAATGTFSGFQSVASLLASSIAGMLWYRFGAIAAFMSSAIITLLVILFIYFKTGKHAQQEDIS